MVIVVRAVNSFLATWVCARKCSGRTSRHHINDSAKVAKTETAECNMAALRIGPRASASHCGTSVSAVSMTAMIPRTTRVLAGRWKWSQGSTLGHVAVSARQNARLFRRSGVLTECRIEVSIATKPWPERCPQDATTEKKQCDISAKSLRKCRMC